MPKTAVIYARFSCNKQRKASIDDQLRICRQWCQRERYAIVAEYCDYAISGRTDDRPEFQRMVANAGESDIVLVYMMDRFSRGEYDAPIYKRELAQHGVKLVSALEQIPDSPEGIIYEKLLEGLAACESKKTAIRTRRGMEGNALKCKTNGVRVFGYASNEADEYVIDEDEAAFVREAFKRRIAKETTNSIARDFATRGVKTSQGNPCGYSMVERMVKNRKYTGRYEWGGVVKEGGMPAIIDEVTFMEAQGIRAAKERSAESWGDFALSGKAICAGCGRNLQGVSGRGRGNRKYEYYRCHDGCVKPVRREELEGEIVKALRALLQDREEALRIARMVAESSDGAEVAARRKQAAQSLSAAERGLKNILNAIEQGIIAPGAKERIAELEHQRDRAKLDLEAIRDDQIDPERLADFLQCGSALDDATLLKAFVYQASVSDEECIVTLNYDVENNEPARLDIQRVRTKCKWCHTDSFEPLTAAAGDGEFLDLPYDLPYDLGVPSTRKYVDIAGWGAAPLRFVIYGPCVNPAIRIDGNWYRVDATVPDGGYMVVDPLATPRSVTVVGPDGSVTDAFAKARRGNGLGGGEYIFQPASPGTNEVEWDRSFGFDLTWYEEEGEPPWS